MYFVAKVRREHGPSPTPGPKLRHSQSLVLYVAALAARNQHLMRAHSPEVQEDKSWDLEHQQKNLVSIVARYLVRVVLARDCPET